MDKQPVFKNFSAKGMLAFSILALLASTTLFSMEKLFEIPVKILLVEIPRFLEDKSNFLGKVTGPTAKYSKQLDKMFGNNSQIELFGRTFYFDKESAFLAVDDKNQDDINHFAFSNDGKLLLFEHSGTIELINFEKNIIFLIGTSPTKFVNMFSYFKESNLFDKDKFLALLIYDKDDGNKKQNQNKFEIVDTENGKIIYREYVSFEEKPDQKLLMEKIKEFNKKPKQLNIIQDNDNNKVDLRKNKNLNYIEEEFDGKKYYTCKQCERIFYQQNIIEKHITENHKIIKKPQSQKNNNLKKNNNNVKIQENNDTGYTETEEIEGKKYYTCKKCEALFAKKNQVLQHILEKHKTVTNNRAGNSIY